MSKQRHHIDLTDPPDHTGEDAILVVDQVGSTERLICLGDRPACQENLRLHGMLALFASFHGGSVVNYTGDGAILRFHAINEAVSAACTALGHTGKMSDPLADRPVRLRAGLHVGRIRGNGVHAFGVALVTAVRVCDRAAAGELLLSAAALERCGRSSGAGPALTVRLKGIGSTTEVHSARIPSLQQASGPVAVGG